MADFNTEEFAKAVASAIVSTNQRVRAEEEAAKVTNDYAAASAQATEEVQASSKKTTQALKDFSMAMGKSAVDLTKAMITGSEGTTKYAGAVQGAADAAGTAAATMLTAFGPLGIIVGGVIKAFGALVGASLEQNDKLMKSYREFSEMGSVTSSLEKLGNDLGRVGLTTNEAEKFGQLLGKTAPDLAAFGGSVSTGKDKFIGVFEGMIGIGNQTEIAMGRIGYSAEGMRDATADYIAKQSRLGLTQGKTTEQLRNESVKYMVSLRELGELTGMSRDQAQKLMDEQQADARWAMTLKRIEAEEGKDAADKAREYMTLYSAEFGKQSATDLMEQIANKGAIVSEASARAEQATNGQAMANFRDVVSGVKTSIGGIIGTANAADENLKRLGPSIMVAGKGLDNMSGGYEYITGTMKNVGRTEEDVAKRLKEQQEKEGGLLNKNLNLEQTNRDMRIKADRALMEVTQISVSVFQKLNEVVFSLGKTLAKIIDKFSSYIGKQTNFSESFKDKDDFKADVDVAKNAVAESEREKQKLALEAKYAQDTTGKTLQAAIDAAKQGQKENQYTVSETGETTGDKGLSDLYSEEVKRLEELKKQIVKKDGTIDAEKSQQIQKEKLLVVEQKILEDKKKLIDAEKNLSKAPPGPSSAGGAGSAGSGAPASPPSAGGGRGSQGNNGGMSYNEALGIPEAGKVLDFGNASGSKTNFEGLDSSLQNKVVTAAAEFNEASGGKDKIKINSAKRDAADQQRLWDESVANGREGKTASGMPIGKPGTSKHERGLAVDIQNYNDPKAVAAMNKQGLFQTVPKDPVHFEVPKAMEGGAFDGPNSGYPVELHGKNESVWPEEKLKATLAEVQKSSIEDYKKQLLGEMGVNSNSSSISASSASSGDSDASSRMMEMLTAKFDDMITQLESSNDTLRNLLTYAKA